MPAWLPLVALGSLLLGVGTFVLAALAFRTAWIASARLTEHGQALPALDKTLGARSADITSLRDQTAQHGATLKVLSSRLSALESRPPADRSERLFGGAPPRAVQEGVLMTKTPTDAAQASAMPAPAPPPPQPDRQWLSGLLADYARMADERGAAEDAFVERYQPRAVVVDGGDAFSFAEDADTAMLWAVSAGPNAHALVPGPRAITNWSGHFALSRASAAQERFGAAFELLPETPRFLVREPALLKGGGDRVLTLARKGQLEGFSS